MRNFVLYLDIQNDWVQIANTKSTEIIDFNTYDEKLTEGENDQYTLSFSVAKSRLKEGVIDCNPLAQFYYIGARLHLVIDDDKRIDLIIKSLEPNTQGNLSIYNITAQDEASFLWSRHNVGYNYTTKIDNTKVAKDIFTIAKEVLEDNFLYDWSVTMRSVDAGLTYFPITLEVTNSNPYNVLIEACNAVNAYMTINYYTKRLDFYRKDLNPFSGYAYHPDRNLVSHKPSMDGSELVTWMHIQGGTDERDNIVTIIPAMPEAIRRYVSEYIFQDGFNIPMANFWSTIQTDNLDFTTPSNIFIPINTFSVSCSYKIQDKDATKIIPLEFNNVPIDTNATYIVTSDPVHNTYLGQIDYQYKQGTSSTTYTIIFDLKNQDREPIFDLESENPYEFTIDDIKELMVDKTLIKNFVDDPILTVSLKPEDVSALREDSIKKQKIACNEFLAIATKHPLLSPSLFDTSMFYHTLTPDKVSALKSLIEKWSLYNARLQCYTQEYYSALWNLLEVRSQFEAYGEVYGAECESLSKALEPAARGITIDEAGLSLYKATQDLDSLIKTSHYKDIIEKFGYGIIEEDYVPRLGNYYTAYFEHLKEEKQKQVTLYEQLRAESLAYGDSNSTAQATYYDSLIRTARTFFTPWSIHGQQYPGIYDKIIELITKYYGTPTSALEPAVAVSYENIQQRINNEIIHTLRSGYGDIIYEGVYSNSTEFDSTSLFNQAYAHFVDINRVKASHSMEVLDIGSLEQISLPRLSVGSNIKVYNIDSPNAQPYIYVLGRIDACKSLIKYYTMQGDRTRAQTKEDELEALETMLQNDYKTNNNIPSTTTITTDQILNAILYDEVLVTGITRVLREPLKDSVTVQQPSRYKTILSKLIKSI